MIRYLSKNQIVEINKSTILAHGGNFVPPSNFLHQENLDYLIDAVKAEMFGEPIYPKISAKAALFCFNIICNNIFTDGTKRTVLGTSLLFLNINRFDISDKITNPNLTEFILKIA